MFPRAAVPSVNGWVGDEIAATGPSRLAAGYRPGARFAVSPPSQSAVSRADGIPAVEALIWGTDHVSRRAPPGIDLLTASSPAPVWRRQRAHLASLGGAATANRSDIKYRHLESNRTCLPAVAGVRML